MAARLSGGFHSQYTTPYATGMNVIKAAMDISLGKKIDKNDVIKTRNKTVYCISVFPNKGEVTKITGLNTIKKMSGSGSSTESLKISLIFEQIIQSKKSMAQVLLLRV